jgi:hypothetical protein
MLSAGILEHAKKDVEYLRVVPNATLDPKPQPGVALVGALAFGAAE